VDKPKFLALSGPGVAGAALLGASCGR